MAEDRKSMWCPLMKEMCTNGWTESMDKGKKKGQPSPKCRFWIRLSGKHPQTGVTMDEYDCSVAWLPTLMVEQCRIENSTGEAVESLRNRVVENTVELKQIASKPIIMLANDSKPVDVTASSANQQLEKKEEKVEGTDGAPKL